MNVMQYKGYLATCEVDLDARLIVGEVLGIRDAITFEAQAATEVEQRFHEAIDDYLAFCAEQGRAPEKSFTGRFLFQTTPERHRSIALAAARAGVSLHAWLDAAAAAAVSRLGAADRDSPIAHVDYSTDVNHGPIPEAPTSPAKPKRSKSGRPRRAEPAGV
jgi:predicted HicB family RNase H-like nuclease